MGKCCLHASSFIFYQINVKVAGNQDRHKSSDEFDFRPDQTTHWRLTRWAYSVPMVRRSSVAHTFKLEYLRSQLANLDKILGVASLVVGKGCMTFWGRWDQNSGFHGNRKPPLTYNGDNGVATFSRLLLIRSRLLLILILAGNEDMHKISDKFEFQPDQTTDYWVSCPWASKKFPIDL